MNEMVLTMKQVGFPITQRNKVCCIGNGFGG
jgi:hypothetical protein